MTLPCLPPSPPMGAFALLLSSPSISIGGDSISLAWEETGPLGVPIKVTGDGLVIFDFPQSTSFEDAGVPGWQLEGGKPIPSQIARAEKLQRVIMYSRINYMNAWATAYSNAMIVEQGHHFPAIPPLDPYNYLKATLIDGQWIAFDRVGIVSPKSEEKSPVKSEVFSNSVEMLFAAEQSFGSNFSTVFSLFHQASHHYYIHQFASSLITAWSISEICLNKMWENYQMVVSSGSNPITKINKDRRDLLNGRDYTASIKSQILSCAGLLSDKRLEKLDAARRARNAFAHNLALTDSKGAGNALTVASEMLSDLTGKKFLPRLMNHYRL